MFTIWLKWLCLLSLCFQSFTASSIYRVSSQDLVSDGDAVTYQQSPLENREVDRVQGQNYIRHRRSFCPWRDYLGYHHYHNDVFGYSSYHRGFHPFYTECRYPDLRLFLHTYINYANSYATNADRTTTPTTTQFSVDMSSTPEEQTSLPTITKVATIEVDEVTTSSTTNTPTIASTAANLDSIEHLTAEPDEEAASTTTEASTMEDHDMETTLSVITEDLTQQARDELQKASQYPSSEQVTSSKEYTTVTESNSDSNEYFEDNDESSLVPY